MLQAAYKFCGPRRSASVRAGSLQFTERFVTYVAAPPECSKETCNVVLTDMILDSISRQHRPFFPTRPVKKLFDLRVALQSFEAGEPRGVNGVLVFA